MAPPIKPHPSVRSEKKEAQKMPVVLSEVDRKLPDFRDALTSWFREQGRDLPWRHTHDPYAILVSEIMLQQTQVATVIDYYLRWMARFPDVTALAAAEESEVLHAWQGLGYYSRARNLRATAQQIVAKHGGVFPRDMEHIRALPGVGRYTTAAVSTFAFDAPTPPVDGNIARVVARLINSYEPVDSTTGLELIWETATRWQPETATGEYNEAMMELGALVCTPRSPGCLTCPVRPFCAAGDPELLPIKKPRRKTVQLTENCGWIVENGQVLLEQQLGTRWRGLWRLPILHELERSGPLVTLDYPFTHHRITLEVFPAQVSEALVENAENRRWIAISDLASTPMPAPHRRALDQLLREI